MANCAQCGRQLPIFLVGRKVCAWCVRHEAAQRGEEPEGATQPIMPVPWANRGISAVGVTQLLFGINVAVFVGMALAGISITDPTSNDLIRWGADWGPRTMSGEWWRLLTSTFLHIGIIHIAFNMWCLWDLGSLCESLYGQATFAAVYLICGVAASLTSVAWHPEGISAGASGAIFGLAGALIASFYLGEFSMPRIAVTATLRSVVAFAGYNLILGGISRRTDNAAHVGGLVTGLILGALIARFAPDHDQAGRRLGVLVGVLVAVIGGVVWLDHSRGYIVHTQRGNTLLWENKADQAVAELQAALRQKPDYLPAHFALARAYSNGKQFEKAEAELKRVIELKPDDQYAYYDLGFVYLDDKRIVQAKDTFARILAFNQKSADAHFGLGVALATEENYRAAVEEYHTAIRLDPELEGAYYKLGLSLFKLKMYDDAVASYLKEQEINGDEYDTEMALAGAYEAKGMRQQARDATEKAAKLKSED
jgi:rhomboid protease GluP